MLGPNSLDDVWADTCRTVGRDDLVEDSSWQDDRDEQVDLELHAQLNAQIAESLGLHVGEGDELAHKDSHSHHQDDNHAAEELDIRLFSSAAPTTTSAALDDDDDDDDGVLAHRRPPSFYLADKIPARLSREYQLAAVTGEDLIRRSHRPSWGMQLPWKVSTTVCIARRAAGSRTKDGRNMARNDTDAKEGKKRRRAGKKTRIAVRIRMRAARDEAEALARMALDKEEHLKEKRKRLNRVKKLRKRAKKKDQKGAGEEGSHEND